MSAPGGNEEVRDDGDRYFKAFAAARLELFQIKAISQLLCDHGEIDNPGFNEEIAGGILALNALATHALDELEKV